VINPKGFGSWIEEPSNTNGKDNKGNSYIGGYMFNDRGKDEQEIIFLLENKYTELAGDLALSSFYNNANDGLWFEFYDNKDGSKLGETEHIFGGVMPFEFKINITGVEQLRVVLKSTSKGIVLSNGFFLK
jgi:hypothetical protein